MTERVLYVPAGFFLGAALGLGLAEQFFVIKPVIRRCRHSSRFPCVADLTVEPEPEIDRGCLLAVHAVLLASIPCVFSVGLYPIETPG